MYVTLNTVLLSPLCPYFTGILFVVIFYLVEVVTFVNI